MDAIKEGILFGIVLTSAASLILGTGAALLSAITISKDMTCLLQ